MNDTPPVKLINRSAIARLTGIPLPTIVSRLGRSGVKPDAVLVVPVGDSQSEYPLFEFERLEAIKAIMTETRRGAALPEEVS